MSDSKKRSSHDRDRDRDRDRRHSSDRSREKERERERDRDRERDKEREREKERERDRRYKREADREREKERERKKEKEKEKEKEEKKKEDKKKEESEGAGTGTGPAAANGNSGSLELKKKQAAIRERLTAWKKTVKPELSSLFQDDEPKKAKIGFLDDSLQDKKDFVFLPQPEENPEENETLDDDFLDDEEKFAREREGRERKKREEEEKLLHGGIQEGMEVSVKEERHFSPIKTEIESNLDGMDIEPDPKPEIEEGKETQPRGETDAKEPTPSSTDNGGFLVPKKKVVNRRKRGRNAGLPEGFEFDDSNGDPLEAFMASLSGTVKDLRDQSLKKARKEAEKRGNVTIEEDEPEEATDPNSGLPKRLQRKNLEEVDHSSIDYMPFKKDFYIEVPEIAKLTPEEIKAYRKELDSVKIKGKDCPKPIKAFAQCGLSNKVLYIMNKYEYVKPTPIQAQALPVVMSGRDIIGIAKTGSGKTLAYLLPLFRHIQDQPPLAIGDGPVGLIMAPTRELATQIHYECKKFKKATGIRSVCVYGGAGVQHQIGDLKRGAEIVVCTPGRMIDILCANRGRITNLRRVTMLILDEADRMFDMGFEPQITRIINNIRPDRQTLLFSATFPKSVEAAARRILKNPLEITVRGRGVVADTVEQNVEIIDEEKKKDKLMELISNWYEQGSILVFVDRQESADQLWKDILKSGYQCLVIHGGKDQLDRDFTIKDFKEGKTKILVATSVAARGLDVPNLRLVVNFDVPNHLEDYVHRVGRTGRAGNIGTAWTFITPSETLYARDIYKALSHSGKPVPEGLQRMYDEYEEQRSQGLVQKRKSGFKGTGYKFDEAEELAKAQAMKLQKIAYGVEDEEEEEGDENKKADKPRNDMALVRFDPNGELNPAIRDTKEMLKHLDGESIQAEALGQVLGNTDYLVSIPGTPEEARERALKIADFWTTIARGQKRFTEELEINDYPQAARWKVTHKDALASITEMTGCGITAKGQFFAPGRNPAFGTRKLYLLIEGNSREEVRNAKAEIKRILDEAVLTAHPDKNQYGKYTVV